MDGEFMSQVNCAMRDGTVNNKKIYDRELTHRENDMHVLQRIQPELDRLARSRPKQLINWRKL
jgi:hypothetical protein